MCINAILEKLYTQMLILKYAKQKGRTSLGTTFDQKGIITWESNGNNIKRHYLTSVVFWLLVCVSVISCLKVYV